MNYVIVDVETTGGNTKDSKITELAMYKHDGTQVIDHFQSLVNPEQAIPEFIVRLTGITDKMVTNAPKFYELAKQIIEFCEGCVFVAHNVSFDYGMFKSEFKRLGYEFRMPQICTVRASRIVLPGHASYSLGKICTDLGIPNNARHRADGDAKATAALFTILIQQDKNELNTFIQDVLNPKSVHPNLSLESIRASQQNWRLQTLQRVQSAHLYRQEHSHQKAHRATFAQYQNSEGATNDPGCLPSRIRINRLRTHCDVARI